MHFNFFGDSWYWDWSYLDRLSSKELCTDKPFDFYGNVLPQLGHSVSNFCKPGKHPYQLFWDIKRKDVKPGISIIFYSHLMRYDPETPSNNLEGLYPYVHDYKTFYQKKEEFELELLESLHNYSIKFNQHFYIVGGQAPFLIDVPKEYSKVKILSRDIVRTLFLNDHPYQKDLLKPMGYFRLASDVTDLVDETWDKDLVIEFYDQIENFRDLSESLYKVYLWPDNGHLNTYGHTMLLDLILKELNKNIL